MTGCVPILGLVVASILAQEDECRAILDKAMQAHGGAEKLAKVKASQAKSKGNLEIMGGIKYSGETFSLLPDKFKVVLEVEVNNMTIGITQVFNGEKFWLHVNNKTIEMSDAKLIAELKETMYAEGVGSLALLGDKKFQLAPLGEVQVQDRSAVGVRVSSKGHRDVNLYFDKKTHLLAKSEYRTTDPLTNQEVNQEKIFSDYQAVDGVQSPRKILVQQDGKRYMELEITEVRLLGTLDDSVFSKP